MHWTPGSWRDFPIRQQPTYPDKETLEYVEKELKHYPPQISMRRISKIFLN